MKTFSTGFILLCFAVMRCHAADKLILWDQNFEQGNSAEIVRMIAEASTDRYGPFTLTKSIHLEQGRAIEELKKGRTLNIAVMGNEKLRETQLSPIYFPIDKGELGLRVCLVHKKATSLFQDIKSAEDTREKDLVFGLGSYWPDTPIFMSNGFTVYSTPVFINLFKALKRKRFDCLSRSISEALPDLEKHGDGELVIESKLAFVYPLANFLYFTPGSKLKARMEYGLNKLKSNGVISQTIDSALESDISELRFFSRKLIIMENPNLTDAARDAINEYGLISFEKIKEKRNR